MSAALETSQGLGPRRVPARSAGARAGNEKIRAAVRGDTTGTLPFFCECGMSTCRDSVWLTLQEACAAIESGRLIIGEHVFRQLDARRRGPVRSAVPRPVRAR